MPCYTNPAYTGLVFVSANALCIIGFTGWNKYEHELSTLLLTLLMLAIQISACIIFIRQDPSYSYALFVVLLVVQLIIAGLFGMHIIFAYGIRHASPTKCCIKRDWLAWMERERLSYLEWLNVGSFSFTLVMCRGRWLV